MKTKKPVKKPKPVYNAKIKIMGKFFEAIGTTSEEAITSLVVPGQPKGLAILTVTKGDTEKIKILNGFQSFRMFSQSPLMRQVALKNIIPYFSNL